MPSRRKSFAAFAAAAWAGIAAAQPVDRPARAWAASCAACHGTDGRAQGGIPPIAGRDAESLSRTLLAFKQGLRPDATVMHQLTKGYGDDELRRIAQVLAAGSATK